VNQKVTAKPSSGIQIPGQRKALYVGGNFHGYNNLNKNELEQCKNERH